MRVYRTIALCLLTIVALAYAGFAQEKPKAINGGVLNGKAIALPKPAYPAEAKAAKLEGTVAIKVTIDEEGNVIETEPESQGSSTRTMEADGTKTTTENTLPDSSLVDSALEAAKGARFSPTTISGEPVKVRGVIVYNFVASGAKNISGGILNGKAIELPLPEFPVAAKAVRASGAVSVQIVIDENGDVISATAVSGHPLLRAAATDAAKLAKFAPTKLQGKPVQVSGVLTYSFVPPDEPNN